MKFYVACLASYNNGVLHGAWIEASTDVDEMQEEVNKILRSSPYPNVMVEDEDGNEVPSAEEWAVHDYDDMPNLGEYPGLEKIAEVVERAEEWEGAGVPQEVWTKLEDHIKPEDFIGVYEDLGDYAYQMNDEGRDVPEHLRNYINWDSVGEDYRLNGDIEVYENGYKEVYIFSNH